MQNWGSRVDADGYMRVAVGEEVGGGLVRVIVMGENMIYPTRTYALQESAYCRILHKIRQAYRF